MSRLGRLFSPACASSWRPSSRASPSRVRVGSIACISESRDALSRLLLRRASEAELLAHAAGLESAGGPSLVDAARAYIQDGGDQLTTDGLDRRTSAQRQADRVEVSARLERASALTRAIRETLTPDVRARIEEDPQAKARLEALEATCYRIELTRNVHNVDVAGVRALRSARMVKLLRLAGHTPVPEPIDFDDDTHIGGRGY